MNLRAEISTRLQRRRDAQMRRSMASWIDVWPPEVVAAYDLEISRYEDLLRACHGVHECRPTPGERAPIVKMQRRAERRLEELRRTRATYVELEPASVLTEQPEPRVA
jgi:hypothetical protein